MHDGLTLAVASSAKPEELEALLRIAGAEDLIEGASSADDVENSKPDPDVVHAALRRLRLPPAEVLMIGDTPYDVEAARRAGVVAVAFRSGGWDDAGLAGAIAIYDDPADLLGPFRRVPAASSLSKACCLAPPSRTFATFLRSSTNRCVSSLRVSSSGARRMDDGWTVAITFGASGDGTTSPRRWLTRKAAPSRLCAAVAPRQTMTSGFTTAISASSHGRQARISCAFGLAWMRRLPRGSHLKCLTTFVT